MTQGEFSKSVKLAVAERAAYICCNPACRSLTLRLIDVDDVKTVFKGRTAHICAPVKNGARFDPEMNSNQKKAIDNAIFLCLKCADLINKNKGAGYPADMLREWKELHKKWVRTHLNR